MLTRGARRPFMRWGGRWVALAMVLATTAAQGQITPRIAAGREALERGDLAGAERDFIVARGSGDAVEMSLAGYFLAVVADERLRFGDALVGYRAFVERDPGSRWASRALSRIEALEQHREGDFAPLAQLERVRRTPGLDRDPAAITGLDRAARGFPPGRVRAEARLLVGEAYLERMGRPRDGARVFMELANDPGAPRTMRDLAADRAVEARQRLGEESQAVDEVSRAAVDPEVLAKARVLARRARLGRAATVWLAALGVLGVSAVLRAWRLGRLARVLRAWARVTPLAQLALLTVGGALLAWKTDNHDPWPFLALGGGSLGVYLVATAWNVVGSERASLRALRAGCCGVGVLAVAMVVMRSLDPRMLEGIGL